jgi:hypothetical protein
MIDEAWLTQKKILPRAVVVSIRLGGYDCAWVSDTLHIIGGENARLYFCNTQRGDVYTANNQVNMAHESRTESWEESVIKVDVVEKTSGEHRPGWYILITRDGRTGYYLYIFDDADPDKSTEKYGYWFQNYESLQAQMEHFGWEVEWLEQE